MIEWDLMQSQELVVTEEECKRLSKRDMSYKRALQSMASGKDTT